MLSKCAKIAYEKGYRIRRGKVFYERTGNNIAIRITSKSPYPKFNIKEKGRHITVKCHQLAAWQKFFDNCKGTEVEIRHLNDNPLDFRLCNIELGTRSDNIQDKLNRKRRK